MVCVSTIVMWLLLRDFHFGPTPTIHGGLCVRMVGCGRRLPVAFSSSLSIVGGAGRRRAQQGAWWAQQGAGARGSSPKRLYRNLARGRGRATSGSERAKCKFAEPSLGPLQPPSRAPPSPPLPRSLGPPPPFAAAAEPCPPIPPAQRKPWPSLGPSPLN